ncbi:hypothetical protein [Shimia sp. FJ5]|uniref:hypothetical protein n=1 Tax=Shimia sp. FJ5 TaxID=3079054 RepID=UPI0026393A98|nr:hypothetical protein [Shimia sp. FJ5]MDV4144694.1 hypothetical protein [Shimia sp. FJ5]
MAKSDKTDTSQETEHDEDAVKTEEVENEVTEAEIVEETEATDEEAPLLIEEPQAEDEASGEEESTEEAAPEETPAEEQPQPADAKRGGFVPTVIGGVVAAGIGFGAATYMQSQGLLLGADEDALAAIDARIAAQQEEIDGLRAGQGDIAANAESAVAASTDAKALEARIDGLSERVESVAQHVITLGARLTEAEKRPMSDGLSASAIEAYEREVEELRAQVAAQLEEAETLKANSEQTARSTLVQAALTRVMAALDSGASYEAALIDLANASGESVPAALADPAADGVPTLPALIDAFPDAARAALAEARKDQSAEDTGSRIGAFLKAQLGARSVTPKEGDDPDAILSRAEAALKGGKIDEALAEIDALPQESKAQMASWRESAEIRAAALAAAEALAQGLTD